MLVYKFGGASIANPERIKALLPIVNGEVGPKVLVISAMGKTTNALEAVVKEAMNGQKDTALQLAKVIEEEHLSTAMALLNANNRDACALALAPLFTELHWAIDSADAERYDYSYDQIVGMGELFSSTIVGAFLRQEGYANVWKDIRDVLQTDATYRDAKVNLEISASRMISAFTPHLNKRVNIITQGFIGATDENNTATLGREGSDYTAALVAAMLKAISLTIWKDVDGLQNADPKLFDHTVKVEDLTYHEAIEMAFYGAQVIHPKTIKPLQNADIPLYVRSFLKPEAKGTIIHSEMNSLFYPPLIILKKNQVLLQVTARDFSFITEENLSYIYQSFSALGIKINLIQTAAISFVACIDSDENIISKLIALMEADYKIFRNEDVTLLTIRHYTPEALSELTQGRYVLLQQKTRHTVQMVMK